MNVQMTKNDTLKFFVYFPKAGLCDHHAVCVSPYQLLNASAKLYGTCYVYHGS
jgi:hypothetical protein